MSVALESALVRSPRVVSRAIAGSCVLVPLVERGADLDSIYNLNRVGAFIWERLDGRTPGSAVVAALVETFEVEPETAAHDYARFTETLLALGALRAA